MLSHQAVFCEREGRCTLIPVWDAAWQGSQKKGSEEFTCSSRQNTLAIKERGRQQALQELKTPFDQGKLKGKHDLMGWKRIQMTFSGIVAVPREGQAGFKLSQISRQLWDVPAGTFPDVQEGKGTLASTPASLSSLRQSGKASQNL